MRRLTGAVYGSKLYFAGNDGVTKHNVELWQTDGSLPGTKMVADIAFSVAPSVPQEFAIANNILFFTADNVKKGPELWRLPGVIQPPPKPFSMRSVDKPGTGMNLLDGGSLAELFDGDAGFAGRGKKRAT